MLLFDKSRWVLGTRIEIIVGAIFVSLLDISTVLMIQGGKAETLLVIHRIKLKLWSFKFGDILKQST